MAKHVFTALFLFIFTGFTMAQLTLEQVDGTKKHVIPVGSVIDLTFPTKTSGASKDAFCIYSGQLKNVSKTSIDVVLTYENRYFVNENGVKIQNRKAIQPPDSPMITQMPLVQLDCITQQLPKNRVISNAGLTVFALAVLSNIFVAPHLKTPNNTIVRNVGYLVMGGGLAIAFVPTRKKYYLQQPVSGSKTLWKIAN